MMAVTESKNELTDNNDDLTNSKSEQEARTLYIRFGGEHPATEEDVKKLHNDIIFVRTPHAHGKGGIAYAFVEFDSTEECKAAKDELAATKFKGKDMVVDFVGENSTKKITSKPKAQLNLTRLFVSGLADGVDKTKLQELFPSGGRVCIPKNSKKQGNSFAFVQFRSPAEAKAAFDASQDLTVRNHKITVLFATKEDKLTTTKATAKKDAKRAPAKNGEELVKGDENNKNQKKRSKAPDGCKLFVRNVGVKTSEEDLRAAFAVHGTVTDAFNPGKGFAFVTFGSSEDALKAIALNGKKICGKAIKCTIAKPAGSGGRYGNKQKLP